MSLILDGSAGVTFPNSTVQASAGSILQVIQATSTGSAATTSGTFISTGFSASITPKFSTSKILVLHTTTLNNQSGTGQGAINLARNGTVLGSAGGLASVYALGTNVVASVGFNYLDSPATTSSTTYTIYFSSVGSGANITFNSGTGTGVSTTTITLMEIAG